MCAVMATVTTGDGVRIAAHHLGGTGEPLLMVHATGLCGQVFEPMARRLGKRFRCVALDQRGHGRSGRPPDGDWAWAGFALDVLGVVDGLGLERPLAMGHSCGGAALVLAELVRPGTFGALWCYEPVILRADDPRASDQGRAMAAGARRRREVFDSRRQAQERYAVRAPFSSFAQEALAAYVDCGLEELPDGRVRLRCRPEDEALIYEAQTREPRAWGTWDRLGEVACPVTVACGELSTTFGPDHARGLAARLPRGRDETLTGLGHFGPLEDPARVALAVGHDLGGDLGGNRG